MSDEAVRQLIKDRHAECGIGLSGSCEAISRWLFQHHNIVTSPRYVCAVVYEGK